MNQIETGKGSFHTNEHILACLSSAPSNEKIIRTAARMASHKDVFDFHVPFHPY